MPQLTYEEFTWILFAEKEMDKEANYVLEKFPTKEMVGDVNLFLMEDLNAETPSYYSEI